MSIFLGLDNVTKMYQGATELNAVFQGTTRVWPGSLVNSSPGPDATFAMNAIQISSDGTSQYRAYYQSNSGGYIYNLGNWRRTTLPLVLPGDVFQVKVDLFLNIGEYVNDQSNPLSTWYTMDPAVATSIRYVAENDQGSNRAIFRISCKDANNRREVWYAHCYKDTLGELSKTPISYNGSPFVYPAWGGTVAQTGNTYFGDVTGGVTLTLNGAITPQAVTESVGTNWVTLSGITTTNIGGSYWVKVTQTASSGLASGYSGPTLNTWQNIETSQNIEVSLGQEGTTSKTFRVQIASDQWGENTVSDQTLVVNVTASFSDPGGGDPGDPPGGGGPEP